MKAKAGLLIHYVNPDKLHEAALIVYVDEGNYVNLVHWNAYGGSSPKEAVPFDSTGKILNSWHFIEEDEKDAPEAVPDANAGASSASDSLPKPDTATESGVV